MAGHKKGPGVGGGRRRKVLQPGTAFVFLVSARPRNWFARVIRADLSQLLRNCFLLFHFLFERLQMQEISNEYFVQNRSTPSWRNRDRNSCVRNIILIGSMQFSGPLGKFGYRLIGPRTKSSDNQTERTYIAGPFRTKIIEFG